MPKNIGKGVLLLDLEQWTRVSFNETGALTKGAESLKNIVIDEPGTIEDFLDGQSRRLMRETLKRLKANQTYTQYYFSERGKPLEILVSKKEDGGEAFIRTAENRLQTMEDLTFFYRTFLASNTAVAFTDTEGTILDVNRTFLDLYGYQLGEVVGGNPRILKSGRQSPTAYVEMWEALKNPDRGFWTGEIINRKKDGSEVAVLLTISSVKNPDGTSLGYIASAIDISKRKRMEEELREKNQELEALNRLKSELVAVTSHDLKSPVNAMISYAKLLREKNADFPRDKYLKYLERIIAAGYQLTEFIQNILDIEKINAGQLQLNLRRVHLDAVVRACVETSRANAAEKDIRISFETGGVSPPVAADFVKMEQVFLNLLSNAVKFSPIGSEINVRGECSRERIRFTVSDRGPGIPESDIEKIFDRYYQVEKEGGIAKRAYGQGVGLGLAIARGILELHRGTILAQNRPGGGCEFIVELPIKGPSYSVHDLSILIADPDGTAAPYLEEPLRLKKVDFFTVRNDYEFKRIQAFERPDVIFLHHVADYADVVDKDDGAGDLPLIVNLQDADDSIPPDPTLRTFTLPIAEIELWELLEEARMLRVSLTQ